MHRSRLSTLLIDVPSDRASDAAAFWSAALGVPANPVPGEAQFTSLPGAYPGLVTAIQAVDDEPVFPTGNPRAERHQGMTSGRPH